MAYWANDEVLKFINLYKTWPVIWDPNHAHHNDRNKVNEAWVRISDEMGIDVADLKRKRQSLTTSLRFHKRKKKEANGQDYKPVWIFYEPLNEFLGDIEANANRLSTNSRVNDAWVRISDEMDIEVAELKRKKDSLMGSFRTHRNKMRDSIGTTIGQEPTYKPCWIFFDVMNEFLGRIYTSESKVPTTKIVKHPATSKQESLPKLKVKARKKMKLRSTNTAEPCEANKRAKLPSQAPNPISKPPLPPPPPPPPPKEPTNPPKETDDECELYAKLLVSKLKKFPENVRQEVMLAIDSCIIDLSRNMRFRTQAHSSNPSVSPYQNVSSSSSLFPYSQRPIATTIPRSEVYTVTEPFCVIPSPKHEQEHIVSSESSQNSSNDDVFSDQDGNLFSENKNIQR